ncbi:MAG: tRNA lysidine(34) synthetase TilS [Vicinamibacterales bacterium]
MKLVERVRTTIRRHALVGAGDRVLVALSGGPDSVALLHLLLELQNDGDLVVAAVAHFHHQLRGADADGDEAFSRDLAASLGVPFEVGRENVRQAARGAGRSIEDMARELRYRFLHSAAERVRADVIAVGHTLDDQAETFLLRLVRGAGLRGLSGIRPRAGRVIRPLIEISRPELRGYSRERGLASRDDPSNQDLSIARNRVRHALIPYLEREFNPDITHVLARDASNARADDTRLEREAIDLASTIVLSTSDGNTQIDAAALRSLDPALSSRIALRALTNSSRGRFVGFEHVEQILRLAEQDDGAAVDLPGQRATRRGGAIVLGAPRRRVRRDDAGPANSFRFPLSIPGEVTLDNQGWAVSAHRLDALDPAAGCGPARAIEVTIAADPVALPLAIRSRRQGDRFRPLGMGHRKKLQDFLVDRKIPRETRDSLPLVVDGEDRIVWVVGESVAEDFRVTEPSRGVILLKARRLGGPG